MVDLGLNKRLHSNICWSSNVKLDDFLLCADSNANKITRQNADWSLEDAAKPGLWRFLKLSIDIFKSFFFFFLPYLHMALGLLASELLTFANGATNRSSEKPKRWKPNPEINLFEKRIKIFRARQTALKDFPWSEYDPLSPIRFGKPGKPFSLNYFTPWEPTVSRLCVNSILEGLECTRSPLPVNLKNTDSNFSSWVNQSSSLSGETLYLFESRSLVWPLVAHLDEKIDAILFLYGRSRAAASSCLALSEPGSVQR